MKRNVILLTGRAGSKSIKSKNVYPVLGRPLAYYPINAAKQSKDDAIEKMNSNPDADSCVSGHIDLSIHPYRTKRVTSEGYLETWLDIPGNTSTNRQNLEPCFVLDGAIRVMRYDTCFPPAGQPLLSILGTESSISRMSREGMSIASRMFS